MADDRLAPPIQKNYSRNMVKKNSKCTQAFLAKIIYNLKKPLEMV
jgi:hypothetical protein